MIVGVVIVYSFLLGILSNFPLAELGGAVFADVTSANIVGYQGSELPADGLGVGPAFINVGGGTIDLMDIKVTGYDPFNYETGLGGAEGDVSVQTLTGGGGTLVNYKWLDYTNKGDDDLDPSDDTVYYGWYKVVSRKNVALVRNEVVLQPGEGLWSVTMTENQRLQSAGEVETKADIETELPADGMMVANPTPVSVDLINCYVRGYVPFNYETGLGGAEGDVSVQTLTGGGGTLVNYKWLDYTNKGDDDLDPSDDTVYYGWYKVVSRKNVSLVENEVVLGPGEGLWSVTMTENQILCWPKVDL